MRAENLPLESKLELCKSLKVAEAASRKWRKALTVEADGIGRFDSSACRALQQDLEDALQNAALIYSDTVPAVGLLREA